MAQYLSHGSGLDLAPSHLTVEVADSSTGEIPNCTLYIC
jgi:hypothetical protein